MGPKMAIQNGRFIGPAQVVCMLIHADPQTIPCLSYVDFFTGCALDCVHEVAGVLRERAPDGASSLGMYIVKVLYMGEFGVFYWCSYFIF